MRIPAAGGTLAVDAERRDVAAHRPRAAVGARIALVPGDRQNNGSVPTLTAADNINMPVLDRYFRGGGCGSAS